MATFYVKKDGSGNSKTIQGAIQMASVGDVIEIEAGTFDENVDLWKGVTLKGAGKSQTIITGATRTAIASKTFTWSLGSTTLTAVAGADLSAYEVGRIVTATGIAANARIVSKTSTSLVISAATTQAATTARAVAMSLQNDATMRVRGGAGIIRDMKLVGFDNPNPATEYATVYFRNLALGSNAANGWEMFNCEVEAAGEYALLTDYAAGVGNLNIHDCKFSGKTFVGSNPASGNQFSVWNVPRQLVTIQSVNTGVNKFMNNEVVGITGGLTTTGVASFNTAVTFDTPNAIVSGNILNGTFGYGYALRVRGAGAVVENNTNYSFPSNPNSGYLIGTISGMVVGSNKSITALLITTSQNSAGQPISVSVEKMQLKAIPKLASATQFIDDTSWEMVSCVFKHESSAKRLVSSSRNLAVSKNMKLKPGMNSGDKFQIHKIIICKEGRVLFVLKREDISDASIFDFILK